jgi:hypothetical protein
MMLAKITPVKIARGDDDFNVNFNWESTDKQVTLPPT